MEVNILDIKKAKRGDVTAFARLYEQVYADLYRFALYTLKNKTDAEDVVSETVTDAFASIGKLKKAEALGIQVISESEFRQILGEADVQTETLTLF